MEGVILDIDGTLVDTNYHHAVAWYEALRQAGHRVPVWKVHRHIGMGGDQIVEALVGKEAERDHGDEVREAHDALYMAVIGNVSVLDQARELMEDLRDLGHPLVLASSAAEQEVDHYLDLLDARELIDSWTTSADVENTKPEPDLVVAALDKLDAEKAVMIGDTPWDIRAAAKVDVPVVAVLTGGFPATDLEEAGAACVLESVAELRGRIADEGSLTALC